MALRNTSEAYGSVAKFLHWAIVLLIVPQYFLADAADELEAGAEKLQLLNWHKSLGLTVLLLALVRIAWKVINRPHPAPLGDVIWQRKAATAGHVLLYALILLQPVTGWIMSSAAGSPISLFGWVSFPALVAKDHALHETFEAVHESVFYVLLAVALVHIAAALYHHWVLKDNVLRRMLPFSRMG